jgi:hypothetical protein
VDEILEITLFVVAVFDRLGIEYLVGGSLASSLQGIPRATQDVDLVARIAPAQVDDLVEALRDTFYLDGDTIREAVEQRTSFNLVHLRTVLKVDVFVAKDDLASREQMRRSQHFAIGDSPAQHLVVSSPEDVVAQKLYWYRLGGEVSDRQWTDALGVLKVAGKRLDHAYLQRIAELLGVEDLLQRVIILDEEERRRGG